MTTALPYIGNQVRVRTRDGQPWFVLGDICGVLGLAEDEASAALDSADLDEERFYSGGWLPVVSEAGACVLAFRSAKPAAREFRRRVLGELLAGES